MGQWILATWQEESQRSCN